MLSGVLDNDTSGTAAINAAGGLTLAQEGRSSEFFDMPAAAIDFGRAQIIAAPMQIAAYLALISEYPLLGAA